MRVTMRVRVLKFNMIHALSATHIQIFIKEYVALMVGSPEISSTTGFN